MKCGSRYVLNIIVFIPAIIKSIIKTIVADDTIHRFVPILPNTSSHTADISIFSLLTDATRSSLNKQHYHVHMCAIRHISINKIQTMLILLHIEVIIHKSNHSVSMHTLMHPMGFPLHIVFNDDILTKIDWIYPCGFWVAALCSNWCGIHLSWIYQLSCSIFLVIEPLN